MLDCAGMPPPNLIVCAGRELFTSFFPAALERRLSRLFRWQRDGARKINPALKSEAGHRAGADHGLDSPHLPRDFVSPGPGLRIIASLRRGGQIALRPVVIQ